MQMRRPRATRHLVVVAISQNRWIFWVQDRLALVSCCRTGRGVLARFLLVRLVILDAVAQSVSVSFFFFFFFRDEANGCGVAQTGHAQRRVDIGLQTVVESARAVAGALAVSRIDRLIGGFPYVRIYPYNNIKSISQIWVSNELNLIMYRCRGRKALPRIGCPAPSFRPARNKDRGAPLRGKMSGTAWCGPLPATLAKPWSTPTGGRQSVF